MKTSLIVYLLLFSAGVFGQSFTSGTVLYKQVFKPQDQEYKGTLQFSPAHSVYYYSRSEKGSNEPTLVKKSDVKYVLNLEDSEGFTCYKNLSDKRMLTRDIIWMRFFRIDEPIPEINWKQLPDHKTILGYDCKAAAGLFRGRTYRVWFAPAIAVDGGPWKLGGLPGLILEATTDDGLFTFVAESIQKGVAENASIAPPKDGKIVSWNQFKQTYKERSQLVIDRMRSQAGNFDGSTQIELTNNILEVFPIQ